MVRGAVGAPANCQGREGQHQLEAGAPRGALLVMAIGKPASQHRRKKALKKSTATRVLVVRHVPGEFASRCMALETTRICVVPIFISYLA